MQNNVAGYLIAVLISVTVLCLVMDTDLTSETAEGIHYCEKVKEYKESNGKYGWPNYKDVKCN